MNEIADIHQPFIAWLNKRGIPFHRNRPDKRTTAIKGDPDFLLTWCKHCLYVECKVPGGKLSKDQENRIAYLRSAGNRVVIACSLQECVQAANGLIQSGGIGDIFSGRTSGKPEPYRRNPADGQKESPSEPAPNLFIADFGNKPCVFLSNGPMDNHLVRTATQYDLLHISRR